MDRNGPQRTRMDRNGHERTRMHLNVESESPADVIAKAKGPLAGPFFKFLLAESWGFEPQMPFWGILA